VIHVALHEPTGVLAALQKAVEDALADELSIAREDRPFTAHVTLGRTKDRHRCPAMDEIAAAVEKQDFGRVKVGSFVLMRSDLRPDGPVYTPVHRFSLGRQE
jgi:2'-5' RNA ligase